MPNHILDDITKLLQLDYFSLFNLQESIEFDPIQLEQAYLQLQRQYHPDLFYGQPEEAHCQRLFAYINEAHRVLGDWLSRVKYILQRHGFSDETNEVIAPEFMQLLMSLESVTAVDTEIEKLHTIMQNSFQQQNFTKLQQQYNQVKYLLRAKEKL